MPSLLRCALLLALALGVVALPDGALAKEQDAAAEAKLRGSLAADLLAYATACRDQGARQAGLEALAEAAAVGAAQAHLAPLRTALESLTEDAPEAASAVAERRKAAGPKVAKGYDRLAALDLDDRAAARATRYATGGYAWEPTKARLARVERAMEEAAKNRPITHGLLLQRLRGLNPEGAARYEKHALEVATKEGLLLGHPDHPLVAWVSLPKAWKKGAVHPVLVGVDGAGSNFAGYFRASTAARGSRAAIVVAPCTLSNTNELTPEKYPYYDAQVLAEWGANRIAFDGAGMEKILDLVRTSLGGDEAVFLTGFSGGGNYCYYKLFMDPAHVRGASPACANFSGVGVSDPPAPPEGGPPVLLMTGAKDEHRDHVFGKPPGIEGQTDAAEARLKELGFQHVRRVQLPVGHAPLHAEVWKFVDEVLAPR